MKITIIQSDLAWEDKKKNISLLTSLIEKNAVGSDLVVLPEMYTTAFSMNPHLLAESMDGPTVGWMKKQSSEGGFAICGTVIIKEEENFFNRMVFISPEGEITVYDKRHLHSMSGEHKVYTHGNKQVNCCYKGFMFNLQICYDLRFPVWSRNRGNVDVIIYSANWPAARSNVWKTLLVARSIENQCYVIGANRTGTNPEGTSYTGDSMIVSPKGEILAALPSDAEGALSACISKEALEKYRNEMPVWRDADRFTLDI